MFLPPWWTLNGSTRSLSLPQHSSAHGCSLPWCGGSWPSLMVIWCHEIPVSLDLFPVSLPSTPSLQRSSSPSRCRWETGRMERKIYCMIGDLRCPSELLAPLKKSVKLLICNDHLMKENFWTDVHEPKNIKGLKLFCLEELTKILYKCLQPC